MKTMTYTITDPLGIHARPAGMLVKLAGAYAAVITVEKEGKKADGKRLFALMGLGVKQGDLINIQIEGNDEAAAEGAIRAFLAENL